MHDENKQDFSGTQADTQTVQVDYTDYINLLKTSATFWFNFLMPGQLNLRIPDFHLDVFSLITNLTFLKLAIAIPRGYAKTTIVKMAVVWLYVFSDFRFIVYCSNTTRIAVDECKDIINFITSDNFIAVFGAPEFEQKNESLGQWIFILTINGKRKKCILRALGAGQQIRGMNIDHQRPQLFVCDDAEDEEITATPTLKHKFKKWVFGPLRKAGARLSKLVWIANLVSASCLINEFCESEYWSSVKYGCIKSDGTPLWPEHQSLDEIRAEYLEYQAAGYAATWFAEMMNMPVPEGMGLIGPGDIKYKPGCVAADLIYAFITVDPAISKKRLSDSTGIAVHGLVRQTGKWQIVEYFKGKVGPIEMFEIVYRLLHKWRSAAVGIEATAYQAALEPFFRYLFIQRNEPHINVIPLHSGNIRKAERITVWAGWLKGENYYITQGDMEITKQLLSYDPKKEANDDDIIDACAYGPQMITEHMNLIMFNEDTKLLPIEGEADVCSL